MQLIDQYINIHHWYKSLMSVVSTGSYIQNCCDNKEIVFKKEVLVVYFIVLFCKVFSYWIFTDMLVPTIQCAYSV